MSVARTPEQKRAAALRSAAYRASKAGAPRSTRSASDVEAENAWLRARVEHLETMLAHVLGAPLDGVTDGVTGRDAKTVTPASRGVTGVTSRLGVTETETPPVSVVRSHEESGEGMTLESAITEPFSASARELGVQDLESCWKAFLGELAIEGLTHAAPGIVRARWQRWCVSWRNNERKDRDKAAQAEERRKAADAARAADDGSQSPSRRKLAPLAAGPAIPMPPRAPEEYAMTAAMMPPHDLEAEAAVLSAVMLDPDAPAKVAPILRPADFYAEAHRRMFEAAIALFEQGKPVDIVQVATWLRAHGRLEQVGGTAYVTEVLNAAPAVANVESYAETVARKARVRRVQQVAQRLSAEAYAPIADEDAWIDRAEQALYEVGAARGRRLKAVSIRAVLRSVFQKLEEAAKRGEGTLSGLATGFPQLDEQTGGLQAGQLDIVGARPGIGKTALAMAMALSVARQGKGVLVFSVEMPSEQLATRTLCSVAGVDGRKALSARFDFHDWRKLTVAAGEVGQYEHLELVEEPVSLLAIRSIVRERQAAMRRAGVELGLVVVDYAQLLGGREGVHSREQVVSENTRDLKLLSKDVGAAVLLLSQLSRAVEQRQDKRPILSDFKESGALEESGDRVIGLYRDDYYHENSKRPGIAEVILLKNKNGPTGTVDVGFRAATTTFFPLRDDGQNPAHWQDEGR